MRLIFTVINILLLYVIGHGNAISQCLTSNALSAIAIQLNSDGTDTVVNNVDEATSIYTKWLNAGSPYVEVVDNGRYGIRRTGSAAVNRIDFGGRDRYRTGTLPYPGFGTVGNTGVDSLIIHISGTVTLTAGTYTIYADTDDGFELTLSKVSGDDIIFSKFGDGSGQGNSNQLRYRNPKNGTNTGGSFTLTQTSVFDLAFIYYDRSGLDHAEVLIANSAKTSGPAAGYQPFRHGAHSKLTFGCSEFANSVHHYRIEHDGAGLTCDTENLVLKACHNADCSILNTQNTVVDVTVDGIVSSQELIQGVGSAGVNYTNPATVTLSVIDPTIPADNATVCVDGSGGSCDITFTDAGFRFLYGTSNATTMPNQTAGTAFSEVLKVQAVENNNGVCEGLFSGNTSVEVSQENITPNTSGGLSFTVDSSAIAKHPATSSTTLSFDTDSIATIPNPIYLDAGQIRLYANYEAGDVSLSGSSNAFWVSPAKLFLSANSGATVLNGASASASVIHPAGEDFELSVTAQNSAGDITPGYSPGQIQLSLGRVAPIHSGTVDGALTYASGASINASTSATFQNVSLSSFASGISSFSQAQFTEVGVLSLDIQDASYGDGTIVVDADAIDLGRFVPYYFAQTAAQQGVFATTCGVNTSFSAYSGQRQESNNSLGAISYLTRPILAITAYNKQGNITQNYSQDSEGSSNDFMKLTSSNIDITLPLFDEVAIGIDGTALPIVASISSGTLSQNDLTATPSVVALPGGIIHYEFAATDNFYYQRNANAEVAPFVSDIDFAINSITDSDGVSTSSAADISPVGVDVRFGRLVLENTFGSEAQNLVQPIRTEHFTGSGYIVSSDNNCTSIEASRVTLSNISIAPSLTSVLGISGTMSAGISLDLFYQATGAGNQGQLGVEYDSFNWLKYDWDNDGVFDENPAATVSFGLFRGDDRLLHRREQY